MSKTFGDKGYIWKALPPFTINYLAPEQYSLANEPILKPNMIIIPKSPVIQKC